MIKTVYIQGKHLVSIDCIIFGYEDADLKVLAFRRVLEPSRGDWSLVGGWVNENESVEESAYRVVHHITGLEDLFLEQVQVYSRPDRDPGDRVISVSFYAFMRISEQNKKLVEHHGAKWFSLSELPGLIFDHNEMLNQALGKLRQKASYELVGRELLPAKFTILQLRKLYNAIYQRAFDPGNFRKKVLSLRVLKRLDSKDTSESRKGAYYFKFKSEAEINNNDRIFKI